MSVARIIELSSESLDSFEDAVLQGIARAGKTLQDAHSFWIANQNVAVHGDKQAVFHVCMKASFICD